MIGQGYWKDWNTQEYLEDLIRLTYPKAKVNDIVPYLKLLDGNEQIITQPNVLYFVKIMTSCITGGDGAFSQYGVSYTGLGIDHSFQVFGQTDFILIDHWGSYPTMSAQLVGWQITLDNEISDIYAGEDPPEILILTGKIFNPTYFYSADNNNSYGEPLLAVFVNVEGQVDNLVTLVGAQLAEHGAAAGDYCSVVEIMAAYTATLPFTATLRGSTVANATLISNEIIKSVTGEIKNYNYVNAVYNGVNTNLFFTNCVPGSSLHLSIVNGAGDSLLEQDAAFGSHFGTGYTLEYPGVIPPGSGLLVTCRQNGFECPFDFYHAII